MELVDRVDGWQQRHRAPAFVVAVVKKYGDDRGGHLAALITYYGFLALFPLLLLFLTVVSYVAHDDPSVRHDLVNSALGNFPIIGQQLRRNIDVLGGNGLALVIGALGLLWGSLGVANVSQHAMSQVWNLPETRRPSFVRRMLRSLLVIVVIFVAVGGTAALTSVVTLAPVNVLVPIFSTVGILALNVGLYWVAFRVLTPNEISMRRLLPGAIVGGVAWTALQNLGNWLVTRQLQHTSELYGTFGIVLGLLFFLYLAGQILVYSAEINVVAARHLAPRSLAPPPLTPADEEALTGVVRKEQRLAGQRVEVSYDRGVR